MIRPTQTQPERRFGRLAAALAGIGLALGACGAETPTRDVVRIDAATAAIVNGEPIFIADVELEALSQGLIQAGEDFGPDHSDFGRVLDQLIDQRLMAQEAMKRGLDRDDQARHRLDIARERILGNLLVEGLLSEHVTDDAIRAMYNEQVKLQQLGDEVRIARILLDDEDTAKQVMRKLEDGTEFAAVAFQYSKDLTTRVEGGELGWVPVANLSDAYAGVVGDTPVGTVSQPFQTDEGWVILTVHERRQQAPKTYEEMRPDIVRFLTLTEINNVLRELRTSAQIERMPTPGTDTATAEANREIDPPPEDEEDLPTPPTEGSGD